MPTTVKGLARSHDGLDYEADPVAEMTSYSRMMHLHTKKQMDAVARSARRRSSPSGVDAHAQTGLSKQTTHSSTSSASSL
ncbi:uncharacterized protein Z518_00903 [Rhinocladiella mackenziei CBS 650.93]|uniref:Uncharacterized protein n=1 Tax=Rhinocladiella mackenziei CBS 650.93 TaxID=1442369 RepID=A0A0D2G4Z9_9EURO|nr:uncharacterized protein Z518_00903 [Rhinocladiella mackenziei CBS 650.93]KIX09822.1 hypothetical protein Z518_00903 [Rhinocladiella mackenziei CBS 650.93]